MDALSTELTHLLSLMAPPYRDAWIEYCKIKARGLAKHYPEDYAQLPSLLDTEITKLAQATTFTPTEDTGTPPESS
jgi:hypothetical protein